MASICCSPPDSVPAAWRRRSAEDREQLQHAVERLRPPRLAPPGGRRPARGSPARSGTGRSAALRNQQEPPRDDLVSGHARDRRPSSRTAPPVGARRPATARRVVVLPAPLAPIRATISPAPTWSETPRSTGRPHSPLGGLDLQDWPGRRRIGPSHGGASRRPARAQVGLDDARVARDEGGRPLGDLLPVVQHHDPVGQRHDRPEQVLDHQDREALAAKLPEERDHRRSTSVGSARTSPRPAAAPGGPSRARAPPRGAADPTASACAPAARPAPRGRRRPGPRGLSRARAAAGSRVRLNAPIAALPSTDRPGNGWTIWKVRAIPSRHTAWGRSPVTSAPSKRTRPAVGRWKPVIEVEERGLARAVRADEPDQLPGLHVEGHVGNGREPAEALGEPPELEQRHHAPPHAAARGATRPPGRPAGT